MTILKQAAIKNADRCLQADGDNLVLLEFYNLLKKGFYNPQYQDVIFQKSSIAGDIDFADAYCFMLSHYHIHKTCAIAKVYVGQEPVSDNQVDEMNHLLSDLPSPFFAKFTGGTQGSDGYLSASDEVTLSFFNSQTNIHDKIYKFPELWVPLEVGTTEPEKTLKYLKTTGLARWPYGSKFITVLCPIKAEELL